MPSVQELLDRFWPARGRRPARALSRGNVSRHQGRVCGSRPQTRGTWGPALLSGPTPPPLGGSETWGAGTKVWRNRRALRRGHRGTHPAKQASEPRGTTTTSTLPSLAAGAPPASVRRPPLSAAGAVGSWGRAALLVLFAEASPASAVWEGKTQQLRLAGRADRRLLLLEGCGAAAPEEPRPRCPPRSPSSSEPEPLPRAPARRPRPAPGCCTGAGRHPCESLSSAGTLR